MHMSDYISDDSESSQASTGDPSEIEIGKNEPKPKTLSAGSDEVKMYGMPVTWSGQPIQCHIRPFFFCRQLEALNVDENDEHTDHSTEKTRPKYGVLIRIFRLHVTLSPSPWITFSGFDAVKLQAIWNKDEETADKNDSRNEPQGVSIVGSGRKIGPLIDTSMIQDWLRQCETEHGCTCDSPPWVGGGEDRLHQTALRVIDVKERRVVNLPPQSRYLALSYVWGDDGKSRQRRLERCLTTKNYSRLQEINDIDTIPLPRTVRDAVILTNNIGERYLWVDALCILQDDIHDLSIQTSSMDLVYSGAIVTIIAACGDNTDSGLSGLRGRERDIFHRSIPLSTDGLHLAPIAALSDQDSLQQSSWNQRGWTLQERLLSRRELIITRSQVYWLCECSMWDEETIFEPTKPLVRILPQALGCHDEWEDNDDKFSKIAFGTHVTQYSTRKLTFPSDALSAFKGIIRRYEYLNQEEIYWGLQTERFDQALVWRGAGERRKALHQIVLGKSLIHKIPMPSWSWLGWSDFVGGNIHHESLAEKTRMGHSKSELVFYSLMSDGNVRQLQKMSPMANKRQQPNMYSTDQNNDTTADTRPVWKGETTITGSRMDFCDSVSQSLLSKVPGTRVPAPQINLPAHDTGRLVFWTSYAQVKVRFKNDHGNALLVQAGDIVVELPSSFPSGLVVPWLRTASAVSQEYILPSNGSSSSLSDTEIEPFQHFLSTEEHIMDFIVISRFYNIGSAEETGNLNIMAVRESNVEAGIWSRLGLAVIEEKDWLNMKRQWKIVILQ